MKEMEYFKVPKSKEPLILEPEDYPDHEWDVILKIFGLECAERVVISDYVLEAFGIKKSFNEKE